MERAGKSPSYGRTVRSGAANGACSGCERCVIDVRRGFTMKGSGESAVDE